MSYSGDCPDPEYRSRGNCSNGARRRKRSSLTSSADCPPCPQTRVNEPCCNSNNDNDDPVDEPNCDDEDVDPCDNYYGDLFLWGFIALLLVTVLIGFWSGGRWNRKGPDANLALESMGACITTNTQGLSCTSKQKVDEPSIIISGQPVIPGSAFCYEGQNGDFMLTLSAPAYVTGITYEHVSKDAHPAKHIESAPKLLLINGITTDSNGQLVEIFLGSFEYLDDGNTIQSFYFPSPNLETKFPEVKVSIQANHGHHFTCVYRIQIHGKIRSDKLPGTTSLQQKRVQSEACT
ncbi:unnamed protein product [Allacma fusca]|uniref:SUN domain-containing protein n=1 Tax=Allacma fusca TaxID=39272 RepID=A0A8J2KFW5_9HEXA|nr:unnamed protein product [Allacma fusca]